jgi:dihydroxyacetone kinase-like predicted kinase
MNKQHKNLVSSDSIDYEREKSVFCLVSGKGFAEILKKLGADDVFCYGKNKPSVERIVKELDRLRTKNIIVAADDKDILMALKYAGSLSKSSIHIVEADNVISLISMLLNISKDLDITNTIESIMNSLNDIRFFGIAKAVRNTTTEYGIKVNKNEFFAMYNGSIILSGRNLQTLMIKAIQKLRKDESLISLYRGVRAKRETSFIPKLKETFPDCEIEEYYGGQYKFDYYVTLE